ncbi:MAG: hypothetical protein HY904_10950 [Deltaproteobacteria bacterium]|nr:hypothetical protein [Deltaproteobacteria bacterium]
MKLVLVATGRRIAPFDDPVGEMPAGTGTLAAHQRAVAEATGLTMAAAPSLEELDTGGEPAWVMMDDLFVSLRLARHWLPAARAAGRPAVVTLPSSRFLELYGQHQDLRFHDDGSASYRAWWLPGGCRRGEAPALTAAALPVRPPFRERAIRFPVPRNILGRDEVVHPLTTTVALHLRHWVHVLWLANLWPQIELVERITRTPLSTAWRLLRSLRPGVAATKWAAARSFNYVARGVSIHPTACVEFSVLGEGCRVGPFALVRGAVLGHNVCVEERANICYSVLGDGDFVSKNSTVFACLGFPDADLCINGMQYCVAGRNSALTSLVRPMDMKYRDDVTVRMDGKTARIRELMVGSCFGHRSFVGPEVLIAPGREIPNGAVVAPRPGSVLTRVDPNVGADVPSCVVDGVLVPMTGRGEG